MKSPQEGIFNENCDHFHYLEFNISNYTGVGKALDSALKKTDFLTTVISFGRQAWLNLSQEVLPNSTPESLVDFATIQGLNGHQALGTQSDVFIWLQGKSLPELFKQAQEIQQILLPFAQLCFDERGFDYFNSMDLIGFEDGTENPDTAELKRQAAVVAKGQPGVGGSLVMCQKWVHNLTAWNQVPVHCQEAIVGRTKDTNEELEGDAMPSDSHVSRTDVEIDGQKMEIYRRSTPFGTLTENGLMYLAFACDLKRFSSQLDSMYGLVDGETDQLLNYSKALTGGYWFAPCQEDLDLVLNH